MRLAGLEGVSRRRSPGAPRWKETRPVAPDRVSREFVADGPNKLWVADITQHKTNEGWLYISVVIDVFPRRVVGWAMDNQANTGLVVEALNMAVWTRKPNSELVHHSDHGVQYTSLQFGHALKKAGILGSMGRVGDA